MVLTLTIGLLLLAALLIPGALVALTWRPEPSEDDTPLYHVLLGLGWSFGLVPFLAFTIVLFTKIPLEPAITLGVGAVVATFAGSIWWNKYGRTAPSSSRMAGRKLCTHRIDRGRRRHLLKYDLSSF